MQNFAKRNGRLDVARVVRGLGGVLLLLIITIIAMRAAWGMYGKFVEAADSDTLAQKQLTTLEAQQTQVTASVDSFTSSRGLEAQVRERYGVVKPGEGQIQIVRDTSTTSAQSTQSQNVFIRLWQALFGWL